VLDTNVLLHDPMCLFRFEEHDIFLPMIVLEELDGHKKGMTEVARNARQTSRSLDALAGVQGADIGTGLQADATGHREAGGKLFFQTSRWATPCRPACRRARPTTRSSAWSRRCVSSNSRQGARSGAGVEGHQHARQGARAGPGHRRLPERQDPGRRRPAVRRLAACPPISGPRHGKTVESWQQGVHTFYRVSGPVVPSLLINQFVYFESPGEPSLYARVTEIRGKTRCSRR
jgi:PhoH-like ATPase